MAGQPTTTAAAAKKPATRKRAAKKRPARAQPMKTLDPQKAIPELPEPGDGARDVLREEIDQIASGVKMPVLVGGTNRRDWMSEQRVSRPRAVDGPAPGLTLGEISDMLARRQELGRQEGHEAGYADAQEVLRREREDIRHKAVAGTLIMVVGQLERCLHALAADVADGKQQVSVLMAELGRAADRYMNGDVNGEQQP